MKVLFIAAECTPFVKIGGLADVVGSLPQALKKLRDCDVRVILPKYKTIPEQYRKKMESLATFSVRLGTKKSVYVGLQTLRLGAVRYYFIDNEFSFFRDKVYDYGDESERFAFFQKAALEAVRYMDFVPDVVHVHDWHAAMVPLLLRTTYAAAFPNVRTVLTIHNLAYQGIFPLQDYTLFNLEYDNRFEFEGYLNFLKCGIVAADRVTTVSPTYAKEILTDYYGYGMQKLLTWRQDTLLGIMNGIATADFDPSTDPALSVHFGPDDFPAGKQACKKDLYARLDAGFDVDAPLVGIVSRLVSQKGFDLIERVLEEMLATDDFRLVVLGDGEKKYNEFFRRVAADHPDKVRVTIGYDDALARRIYAAADLFLMPSKFEPCGLGQLIAMRYGTLPLVRETGGLVDSVRPYNEYEGTGTGFSFTHYNAHDMMHVLRYAFRVRREQRGAWNAMVRRAMAADFSWEASARAYKQLYRELMKDKGAK
ncbi:MAG: glycogen synthase [Candidatus Izemoplasmatales bacterium]